MAKHRLRWLWIIPGTLVAIVLLVLLFLNPIVTFATQKGLDRLQGASGTFKSLSVTLIHPGYDLYGLKIVEMPAGPKSEPIAYADRIEMRWSWREIIRGHLVRRVKIWKGRFVIPMRPGENGKPAQPPLEIARALESVPSAGLERLSVVDTQVIFVDEHHEGERLWIHNLEMTLENMASRKKLMKGLPLLVTLRAKVQNTGELTAFLTMDPFDKGLTFAGSVELRHLALADLHQFTTIKGLKLPEGSIDVFASVTCKRGNLTGGVKPILKNVKVEAADDKLGDKIKAVLADAAVKILSDRVPGRNAVAAIIPIHGDLKQPEVQLVPTILAVLRNAFVEGLSASLTNVPPPVGGGGILHQARQALSKKSPKPIEATPTNK
ncbi:MAG: hypothetical protein JWN44_3790 [Myxococcales bacterium]|nr:hypothetical protein [Myxococcales bacterium]